MRALPRTIRTLWQTHARRHGLWIGLTLCLVLVLGASLAYVVPRVARAATTTYYLTSCDYLTLATAISKAGSGDTIELDCSGTISDLATLTISQDLTLRVGTGDSVTLDGSNTIQVLYVDSGVQFTLDGLNVAHGKAPLSGGLTTPLGQGGGLYNAGGTVSLSDCAFSGNSAAASGRDGQGGGLYNAGGTLSLTNCTFSGNSASGNVLGNNGQGGGLYNAGGTVSLTNCTFGGVTTASGNTASGGGFSTSGTTGGVGEGGGLYDDSGTLTIDGTTFGDNTALGGPGLVGGVGEGGGFFATSGALTLSGDTFSGNTAQGGTGGKTGDLVDPSGDGNGGGFYAANGTLAMTGGSFSDNNAKGGTVAVSPEGPGGAGRGGGLALVAVKSASLNGGSFSGNSAVGATDDDFNYGAGLGGGLYSDGVSLTVSALAVSGNTANGANAKGGGMYSVNDSLTLSDSDFSDNQAQGNNGGTYLAIGGGLDVEDDVFANVSASTFSGNQAIGSNSPPVNHIPISEGGGIAAAAGSGKYAGALTLTNDTLTANASYGAGNESSLGGAIYTEVTATLTNLTVDANRVQGYAYNKGGALFTVGSVTVRNSILADSTLIDGLTSTANCFVLSPGTITDDGHNLESAADCGFTAGTDLQNTAPDLTPLGSFGGPTGGLATDTMALYPGSPAIDTGGTSANGCPATDQRGVSRPQGSACDIGAYEFIPTTATFLSALPASAQFGQAVLLTATVTATGGGTFGTPTGTVTFSEGSTTLGTASLSSGQAQLSISTLAVGTHLITASYGGGDDFSASASGPTNVTITAAASTTTLKAAPTTAYVGQPVTLTASVVSTTSGTPTGTVTFSDGTTTLGTGTLNTGGQATLSVSTLAVGSHSLTASYGGDSSFAGGTSKAVTVTITLAPSTTSLMANPTTAAYGQPVTLTASVSGGGVGNPTGAVTFLDGTTTLGSAALNLGGKATLTVSTLAVGSHSLTASYGGDGTFAGSASGSVSVTITRAATTTTLSAAPMTATVGQPVKLTATVAATAGTPTGSVTFSDGTTALGTGTLNGKGQATLSVATLAVGGHSLTASYGGDGSFAGGTSPAVTVTITTIATTTTLSALPTTTTLGQPVTLTASVASTTGTPTGTITFSDGTTTLGTASLNSGGKATLVVTTLAVGSHSLTASYGGDGTFAGGTSKAVRVTITLPATSTALSATPTSARFGQRVTLFATVAATAGTPSGTVTFSDGTTMLGTGTLNGSGQAALATSGLAVGTHSLTATYKGNSAFAGSVSAAITVTISRATTTTTLAATPNPVVVGQRVTLTAAVDPPAKAAPSGTVTFKDGGTTLGRAKLGSGGKATLVTATLALGSHTLTASYGGDTDFAPSGSAAVTLVVGAVGQDVIGTSGGQGSQPPANPPSGSQANSGGSSPGSGPSASQPQPSSGQARHPAASRPASGVPLSPPLELGLALLLLALVMLGGGFLYWRRTHHRAQL